MKMQDVDEEICRRNPQLFHVLSVILLVRKVTEKFAFTSPYQCDGICVWREVFRTVL